MSGIKRVDILGDILNDSSTGRIRGLDELIKLTHMTPGQTMDKAPTRTLKKKKKAVRGKRRKTTHYLAEEVFDNLGEVKEGIRDFLPDGRRSQATKSRIVESAITVILNEFEEKGKDSALVRELLKKNHDKES